MLLADLTVREEAVVEEDRLYLEEEVVIWVTPPVLDVKVQEMVALGLADTEQLRVTSPFVKTL